MSDLLLRDPHIPAPYRNASYQNVWMEEPVQGRAYREITSWRPDAERPNLLLWGKPGLGKTFLAVAQLNERQKLWEFKTKSGEKVNGEALQWLRQAHCPVYFVQLAELIQMHIRSFDMDKDTQEYQDLVTLLNDLTVRAKWLVIDDVGKEHATSSGFSIDTFDLLVRNRFNNGLNTILTSNMAPSMWTSSYSDSMRDFIQRTSKVVKFA